jgi:TonB-dependent starch-binding outer membrane protein SusC
MKKKCKILLIMKLSTLLMVIFTLNLSAIGFSQFSFNTEGKKIREVFDIIENQSNYRFFYNDDFESIDKVTNLKVEDQNINQVLDNLFESSDFTYKVFENNLIVVSLKDNFQPNRITGTVTDINANPMPGVNIQIEGTTVGSISDVNGRYSIEVQNANNVIVFSFLGYVSQKVTVGNKTVINVSLTEEVTSLNEVVVVGYGTQKKINITGSVSNINSEALESKNVTRGSLALAGEMSGVSVRQLSGNPVENAAEITIRGLGTFSSAGNSPLILVDGIESSLDDVDANDIKSVSVLKDAASASIYGSQAANGVIMVETKKGIPGAPKFSLYSYVGKQTATEYPEMVSSWEYAVARNEALENVGMTKTYTDEDIQKYKSGTDPAYPNFDHLKYLWTSGSGLQTKMGIRVSGGTPVTQYLFSAGYLNHEGVVMKNYNKRYDMRLNLNTKLMDNVKLNVNLSGNSSKGSAPSGAYDAGIAPITRGALRMTNNRPGPMADGYWGNNETIHPEADLNSPSFLGNKDFYLSSNTELVWDIFKNIKITGKVGYTYGDNQDKWYRAMYAVNPTYTVTPNYLNVDWSNSDELTLMSLIEYNKSFGDHSIHLLGGFSQQHYRYSYINAYRESFPNNDIFEINAGSVVNTSDAGGASESKLRSYFGRANYSYLDKYLIEANLRYDGSSRFPKEHRYGLFPSVSVGWLLSKENFFQDAVPWMNELKIRGSWGELGNQSVGDYPYQSLISFGANYPFGSSLAAGAAVTTIPNKNISWERTRMIDAGFDASAMDGKLAFTADYFVKTTSDILYDVSASAMLGASTSPENAGTVENRGWDFDLSHKNTFGDFSYKVSAIFSVNHNKVISLANVDLDVDKGLFVGYPIGSKYGYLADGLFVDQTDVNNYPTQPYTAEPGTIRFKDISGPDGVPDGIVNSTYDRTVIGMPVPITTYGLNLNAKYKGFDLALLFQGEGGRKAMITAWHFFAFDNNGNIQRWMYDERWTKENPDRNAGYPRLEIGGSDLAYFANSSYWMKNATFLRLKNVQIGYNIPSTFANKLSLDNIRIYISGENLFTISHFYKGWDPEMHIADEYGWYPLTRLFLGGINIDF